MSLVMKIDSRFFVLLVILCFNSVKGRATVHWIWPRRGSIAGGTVVNLYGNGFATDGYVSQNLVFIGQVPCIVRQYTSSLRRLECITEPHPDAQEEATYSSLQASIITNNVLSSSTGTQNQFLYHWSYTPQVRSVLPQSGPISVMVELGGYRTSRNYNTYSSVLLGEGVCETRNKETNRHFGMAYRNSLTYVKCLSTERRAGPWNASMVLSGSSGRTWNHSQSLYPMYDWSLAMYEIFPDIHGITPPMGSVNGGTLLTITGTGFDTDSLEEVTVDIDGIPCQVISSSSTEIRCWTGDPPLDSPAIADENMTYSSTEEGYRFKGSRGVNYLQYNGISGNRLSYLQSNRKYPHQPDFLSTYPSYSTSPLNLRRGNNYGARFTAFFNPHTSGNHTFFMTNDDEGGVWFTEGNNISEVNRIILSSQPTGFTQFNRYDHQKAETLHLEQEENYLLVAEFKEGLGGDYMQVGVLMHDTNFTYKETRQSVRESQQIELRTAGMFEVQRLEVSINISAITGDEDPMVVVEWGGRESQPMSVMQLGTLNTTITNLFSGMCEEAFGQELGYSHFRDIHGFESSTSQLWTAWDGAAPMRTNEEAFCGRYSLYIQDSRTRAPYPSGTENAVRISDYPFLCLGYKLPFGHSMAIALRIKNIGWRSISLSSNPRTPFPVLASFWDYSNEDRIIDDDRWHFACTDLEGLLGATVTLSQDPNNAEGTVQSTVIEGLGFYSEIDSLRRGFYIDEFSLSSENRQFETQYYLPPAQPNGVSIHNISMEVLNTNISDVFSSTYLLTIIPTSCESDLPLINITLLDVEDNPGILVFNVTRHREASTPLEGNYTLSFGSHTTVPIPHSASPMEIKTALEALHNIGEVTVSAPQHLPHDVLGNFCAGRRFQVQFEENAGDLPLLELDPQGLSGDELHSSVTEVTPGGLFLRPIPGHMLQTAEITPQVHVHIRGQLAACSGNSDLYKNIPRSSYRDTCGFKYGPLATPNVTSVHPQQASAGDTITVIGSSFSNIATENSVLFGGVECRVTSCTTSSIECILGQHFAGFKPLYLHVLYSGVAETNDIGIEYDLTLNNIAPSRGSQGGSTEILITGTGFYHTRNESMSEMPLSFGDDATPPCGSGWRNQVRIGGNPCVLVQSTSATLTVMTPANTGISLTYDLEVSVFCADNPNNSLSVVLPDAYTYDAALTPSVTSVTPTSGSLQGGTIVTITGVEFSPSVDNNQILFDDAECGVISASSVQLICITPPHARGEVVVSVLVRTQGKATGTIRFTYIMEITSISHCSGSLFGGQVIAISGRGFGSNSSQIDIDFGGRSCELVRTTDSEVMCVTTPASRIYQVNNNVEHDEYGLGYRWNPSSLTVHVGDTVSWSWTGSLFTTRRSVVQVDGPGDTVYNGVGFRSGRSTTTGSFNNTFTKPGLFHYIAEGYGHIGFRGTVRVLELEDIDVPLSFTINSIPLRISDYTIQCTESGTNFLQYSYSVSSTPVLLNLSSTTAVSGDELQLEFEGISETPEDNIFFFGGSVGMNCSLADPPSFSTTLTSPSNTTSTNMRVYTSRTVTCTVPDVPAGVYYPRLHVAGRGWGHANLGKTMLTLHPQITGSPSVINGSLRGGLTLTLPTRGLLQSDISRTKIQIGNTPCSVQDIDSQGLLTCFTRATVDDGYSSLIRASSPLAYWSLQADYYRSNDSYLSSDGSSFFRSSGSLDIRANASIHGMVSTQQAGISGNSFSDQSIQFTEAAYLQVPTLEELFNPSGFAMEFWLKFSISVPNYRFIVNASSTCEGVACGFIVVLNLCNEIEFWVAGSESNIDSTSTECTLITDTSQCPQACRGHIRVPESRQLALPSGVWHVIRNGRSDWTDWHHVYISWQVNDDENEYCISDSRCNGRQGLTIDGERLSIASTYFRSNSGIQIGGCSSFPLGSTGLWSGLAAFRGYLDEVAYYSKPLQSTEIASRVRFGTQDIQPIWLSVEGMDGSSISDIRYPEVAPMLNQVMIDWESAMNLVQTHEDSILLQFEWTMSHGVRQVSRAVFESCDLEAEYIIQWAPNVRGGRVNMILARGQTYYFIDSIVGGCSAGRKLSVQIGNVRVIDWRIRRYEDITIPEGTGLIFRWSGTYHNLLEMSSPVSSDCKFVNQDSSKLGQVRNEWLKGPDITGEVTVTGLSVGEHHFTCSVGDHCQRGMRLTVTVESERRQASQDTEPSSIHNVQWLIQDYEDLTIVEGDIVSFYWAGFHSLHQVTEDVYTSCNTSLPSLYAWGEASVDTRVNVENLTPGNYYFICSVAGHCSAGMKIKVIILPNDGLPVLQNPVAADCGANASCYFSYSTDSTYTPKLLNVRPVNVSPGSTLTLHGVSFLPPNAMVGGPVNSVDVWLGNALCTNIILVSTSPTEDVISCTVPNYESEYYHVDVHVQDKGFASVHPTTLIPGPIRNSTILASNQSPYPHIFLQATATSIMPGSGSVLGGSELVILGNGFSKVPSRVSIRIGQTPCIVTSSSHSEIRCISGHSSSLDSDVLSSLSLTVNGFPITTSLQFMYLLSATPTISSVNIQSVAGGETITISGTRFGTTSPQIQIVPSLERLNGSQSELEDACAVVSSTDTSIICTLPYKAAGAYQVSVRVDGLGFAKPDTSDAATIAYVLDIDDFTPKSAGNGGDVVLMVTGSGFPSLSGNEDSEGFVITLCDIPCSIQNSSLTRLTCILSPRIVEDPFSSSLSCNMTINYNNNIVTSDESFVFLSTLTPRLISISPAMGGTAGGTMVTLTGSGFFPSGISSPNDLVGDDIIVSIDGAVCQWMNFTISDAEITCETSSHRTTLQAEVKVHVRGKGKAVYQENMVTFEYIDLWSSPFTWGGGALPGLGESVYIRLGQTVFLDISPPLLNLLLIEGVLIFSDDQDLHLQAKYIFVNNGTFQVGTEEMPFQHRATITLHGNLTDPEIPIYGAKVLGVRQGQLDLHGRPHAVTWTRLAETARANSTTLTLQQEVDWEAGDRIVVAPTQKDGNETEEHEILSVNGRVVELTRPLNFTHFGITETLEDGSFIDIRAEVGLLSHNVIVQGALMPNLEDQAVGADQYGAQIFIHRMGPHPTPIRIEHTEVRFGGQAFRLGRYSIHFHLSGSMNGSYVKHCSIHHSFNRAITAHGVHDLLIQGNVAYDIMGHTYFIEDGIETNNRYLYNLGVLTRGSSSLLNTDQIPATFWITNPQNTFIGNAAAASRAYGFWYDLDDFPSGASYTRSVCPNKQSFGEFRNNTAHSCNEFGLRIWERYIPYTDGCRAMELGEATLYDFTSYGNGIHGVELSVVGHVRLSGFKVADNVVNGIEIQETHGEWGGPQIINALIVSHTSVNTGAAQTGGIKTPNTPRLTISNVTFANFDLPTTSCLRACSQCKVRQGGFEVHFQQLRFIGGSEQHKTAFQWEFEVLYRDLDGSLTGLTDGGWVLPNSSLTPDLHCTPSVPEFSGSSSSFNGTVCTNQTRFLRMAWNQAMPLATLRGVNVNISNEFGTAEVPWRHYRLTHTDGYMFTMPQGYVHTITWKTPLTARVDATSYRAGVYGVTQNSRLWISHDFIMLPDHVTVGENSMMAAHGEVPTADDENFSWFISNQTNNVTYLISGANFTEPVNNVTFEYRYEPCPPGGCPPPGIDYGPYESRQRRWSENNSWPLSRLPMEGEDVTISSRWRMLMDISPPHLGNVYIFGELKFEDVQNYNFTANLILIQGPNSRLIIGTESSPFTHSVILTLTGVRQDRPLVLGRRVIVGSKAIGVFGNLSIHGVARQSTWTRLMSSAVAGSTNITLSEAATSNLRPGDKIVIAPSGYDPMQSEIRIITSINGGLVSFLEPLQHDHLIRNFLEATDLQNADPTMTVDGSSPWWGDGGSIAPEVGLLTHNIVIQGGGDPQEVHHYGCRILVGRYTSRGFMYSGSLKMDSVEVRFCGQGGYFSPRDPRYSIAFRNNFDGSSESYIKHCSIHHGYNTAIGIHTSNGVEVSGNVIWRTTDSSVKVGGSGNVIRNNLAMLTTTVQPNRPPDAHAVDFPATFDVDFGNTVRDNAAAGSTRLGFQYAGEECLENDASPTNNQADFWNNTAHSGLIGLNVLGLPYDCTAIGGFTSMYQWNYGVFSSTASSLVVTHLKVAVGKVGVNLNVFGPNPVAHLLGEKFIRIADSLIVGSLPGESCDTTAPEFQVMRGVSFTANDHKLGIMMSSFNQRRSKMDGTGAWHLMKGYPVINGVLNTSRLSFARFNRSNHNCMYGVFAVGNNPLSPDAVHPMQMTGTNKYSVDLDSLAFYYEPDPEWIVQEDCVDMDCDGPKHALVRDIDGRFVSTYPTEGSIIPIAELRFSNYSSRLPRTWLSNEGPEYGVSIASPNQVVQNMGIARGVSGDLNSQHGGCELRRTWQAYRCKTLQHHMLVIESLDADTETRRLSPLALVGGDVGTGEYTDLINGPMDHGWCTYYTCLKRLSTFFTIVAVGSDYCVWMTGSPPSTIRFHLLNAGPEDAIKMCIWFKTTQRKDVYKNGIFIEPENVQYVEDGAILQTDGNYVPTRSRFGGANYFSRESHIMHVIIKGSDPVEIRTPPVIQVSLSLAVSLDEFFNVGELINNIAFALNIDKSKIRVVKIVSESSGKRTRRSLLATAPSFNHTSVTIELGNPPLPNISMPLPPSIADEIEQARETNDSVDLEENRVPEVPLNGSNPLNVDPPETVTDFVGNFNSSAFMYLEEVEDYVVLLQDIQDTNALGEQFINLILTGESDNITNATILEVSAIPALPPPPPQPPIIPPMFQNISSREGDPIIVPVDEIPIPTLVANSSGGSDGTITFIFPANMRVTLEPQQTTGHLVHVQVTIFDDNNEPVINLGLVNPWLCEASLVTDRNGPLPRLGGVTSVPFVRGVADFTRLRVDRPGEELTLMFVTNPSRFQATTSVRFRVVAPSPNTPRTRLGFVLNGDSLNTLPSDSSMVKNSIKAGLGSALDVDISRIADIKYMVTSNGLIVEFDLLDKHSTDPPDVLSLQDSISRMQQIISSNQLTISIEEREYTGVPGSFEYVTPAPPTRVPTLSLQTITIAVCAGVGALLFLLVLFFVIGPSVWRSKKKKRKDDRVTPMCDHEVHVVTSPGTPDGSTDGDEMVHIWATREESLTGSQDIFLRSNPETDQTSFIQDDHDCWSAPSPPNVSLVSLSRPNSSHLSRPVSRRSHVAAPAAGSQSSHYQEGNRSYITLSHLAIGGTSPGPSQQEHRVTWTHLPHTPDHDEGHSREHVDRLQRQDRHH